MKIDELASLYGIKDYRDLTYKIRRDTKLNIMLGYDLTRRELREAKIYIEENIHPKYENEPEVIQRDEVFERMHERPISELLELYSIEEMEQKFLALKKPIPDELVFLIKYENTSIRGINGLTINYFVEDVIISNKQEQFENELTKHSLNEDDWQKWHYQMAMMWLSAELAFQKICQSRKLDIIDLNNINIFHGQDYEVNGKKIDVKSRCVIENYIDWSLDRKRCDPNETIAFFACEKERYKSKQVKTSFLGLYDPDYVSKLNIPYIKGSKLTYLNPLFFLKLESLYPTPKVNKPVLEQKLLEKIVKDPFFSSARAMEVFDRTYLLEGLLKINMFGVHTDLANSLAVLSRENKEIAGPVILFNYLIKMVKDKLPYDPALLKKNIFPFCDLNEIQQQFCNDFLDVVNIIRDENNRCRFTGVPFKDCEITFHDSFQTIRATSPFAKAYESNTILTYSWKTTEILRFDDPSLEKCKCGCLVHYHYEERIGRAKCPYSNEKKKAA